jgi:hypothetical protein
MHIMLRTNFAIYISSNHENHENETLKRPFMIISSSTYLICPREFHMPSTNQIISDKLAFLASRKLTSGSKITVQKIAFAFTQTLQKVAKSSFEQ